MIIQRIFIQRIVQLTCLGLAVSPIIVAAAPVEAGLFKKNKDKKAEKILAESYQPGPGWEGYFRDPDGLTKKIVEPVEVNPDRDWLGLTFTDYDGPKLTIGVMKIENRTPYGEATGSYWRGIEVPTAGIEELLTTALYQTHRFEIIERKRLGQVLGEQRLGTSGIISEQTAAETGKVQGVDYLIYGAVNEWTPEKGGRSFGGIVGKKDAEVTMSFTVADPVSGSVLYQITERGKAGSWAIGAFGANVEKKSPTGYAVEACVNKAVYALAHWLEERPWRGSVVKIDRDQVFINAGRDHGMTMGMKLIALSKGDELIDPETGLSLGSNLQAIGTLMITAVSEKFSTATIFEGCEGLRPGDRVELSSNGAPEASGASAPVDRR